MKIEKKIEMMQPLIIQFNVIIVPRNDLGVHVVESLFGHERKSLELV